MKTTKILKVIKSLNEVSFEVHCDSRCSLMMYYFIGDNAVSEEVASASQGSTGYIFHEWLSVLLKLWKENRVKCVGYYDHHDSINPYNLTTGERENINYPKMVRGYIIDGKYFILDAGKRFPSVEAMDKYVELNRFEIRRRLKVLREVEDGEYIYSDISTGAIEKRIFGITKNVNLFIKRELKNPPNKVIYPRS